MKGLIYFSMKFELEILDGAKKGKRIRLKNGLIIGREQGDITIADSEMADAHAVISYGFKNSWNIECLAPAKMRLGSDEVTRAALILGLIFHLGQTGFKVVEKQKKTLGPWKDEIKEWLDTFPARQTATEIFFFLHPLRLRFIKGPQYEDTYTLSYGPRMLGYNNLDLDLKDPSSPPRVAKFFQVGDKSYIENLCGPLATINGTAFDQHLISNGDLLRISSYTIELSILT